MQWIRDQFHRIEQGKNTPLGLTSSMEGYQCGHLLGVNLWRI